MNYVKTDKWYTKAKLPIQHEESRKFTRTRQLSSTQSSHLQEPVPSHVTKIPFDHVILEDRQSFAANVYVIFAYTKESL